MTLTKPNPTLIDDENPEFTQADFDLSVKGSVFFTPEQLAALNQIRANNAPITVAKKPVSVALDWDIVEKFKATGTGWQSRINETLRQA